MPKLFDQRGYMKCVGICKIGMVKFNVTIPGAPQSSIGDSQLSISNGGIIVFHGPCEIATANRINVGPYGCLNIGKYVKIMHFCNITAYTKVIIGDYSWIAHRCQVLDTNFHFIADYNTGTIPNMSRPIKIGAHCWICNNTSIAAGAIIPDKIIVASNSLVNKDMSEIPAGSLIGGVPAKFIKSGYVRVDKTAISQDLWMHYVVNGYDTVYKLPPSATIKFVEADY